MLPSLALAQTLSLTPIAPPTGNPGPITSLSGGVDLIQKLLGWVATVFWIAAVACFFYAGYLYLLGGSSEAALEKAKQQLTYGAVAVAVGLMAYGFPALVNNFLRGK